MSGRLYAIGVGPGDPELLTLKAVRVIQSGAVIAYPVAQPSDQPASSDSGTSLARQIAAPHIADDATEYGFPVPMRLERTPASDAYDEAALEIARTLEGGRDVALLCEGDPFFYGSAMYLVERLSPRFDCEIVAGVTSLTACAAAIGRPLAARNERLKILPAPMDETMLEIELANTEAAAIIKVGRHFEKLRTILRKLNLADAAVLIERATGASEQVTPLNDIEEGDRPYFSTILIYKGAERWGNKHDQ